MSLTSSFDDVIKSLSGASSQSKQSRFAKAKKLQFTNVSNSQVDTKIKCFLSLLISYIGCLTRHSRSIPSKSNEMFILLAVLR